MRKPALIFDLDGTLVDSVYQHVQAWHSVLMSHGLGVGQWKIHRAIGMSGSLFLPKLLRDEGHWHSQALVTKLEAAHGRAFRRLMPSIAPIAGAEGLLKLLRRRSIPFAVATSGDSRQTQSLLGRVTKHKDFPVVSGDDVETAKPAPDVFEIAIGKLEKLPQDCFIVGDSVWDVLAGRRINASVVALRCGGFDAQELQHSGAYRVYDDPLDFAESLEQLGISISGGMSNAVYSRRARS